MAIGPTMQANYSSAHLDDSNIDTHIATEPTKDPTHGTTKTTTDTSVISFTRTLIDKALGEATFFRVHVLAFTFIPLVTSGIFYAANGRFRVDYLDSLFLCYSAMTVCGLSTVNLSTLTAVQQAILFALMVVGDITTVSWVMVLVRKRYFRTKCEYIVASRPKHRRRTLFIRTLIESSAQAVNHLSPTRHHRDHDGDGVGDASGQELVHSPVQENGHPPPPPPVTSRPQTSQINVPHSTRMAELEESQNAIQPIIGSLLLGNGDHHAAAHLHAHFEDTSSTRTVSNVGGGDLGTHDDDDDHQHHNHHHHGGRGDAKTFSSSPKSQSIKIESPKPLSMMLEPISPTHQGHAAFAVSSGVDPWRSLAPRDGVPTPRRRTTYISHHVSKTNPTDPTGHANHKYEHFGGFPGIVQLAAGAIKVTAPHTYRNIQKKVSVLVPAKLEAAKISWLNFDLSTGRNSDFHTEELSDEELEDIGGVEYRALRLLSYLVPMYFIGTQLVAYLLFAPWISTTSDYDSVFEAQPRLVKKPWFALFQVLAAYTGGGMSLVDLGMLPFQTAYLMIFGMIFCMLAGNHALPIFMRFVIWVGYKLSPKNSEIRSTFDFLLEHPRRCFLYLFPSHQTWFLVISLVGFSAIEWVAFGVLNIGIEVFDTMALAPKIVDGLFQGLAARASGFSIVPLASLAPALQFLYVIMMYIAVYPVAMSIRSTNVYEERSLGVFEELDEDVHEEPEDHEFKHFGRRERLGRYLGWHFKKQMTIDIWWVVWAVFIIAIIERKNLLDEDKKWFDMFRILFELVSAFGGIGLSLGLPSDNFAFVGAMRPLSKLVVIVIMVRGRHRSLPVAIDRAVLLPSELVTRKRPPQKNEGLLGAVGAV